MKILSVCFLSALLSFSQGMIPQASVGTDPGQPGMFPGETYPPMMPGTPSPIMPGAPSPMMQRVSFPMMPGASFPMMPGALSLMMPGALQQVMPGAAQQMMPGVAQQMMPGAAQQMMPGASQQMMPGFQTLADIGGPFRSFNAGTTGQGQKNPLLGMLPFLLPGMNPQTKRLMLMMSLFPNMGRNGGQGTGGNAMMRMLPLFMGGALENMSPMMMMMMGQSGLPPQLQQTMQMVLLSGGEMNMMTMLPMFLAGGGLGQGQGNAPRLGGHAKGGAY